MLNDAAAADRAAFLRREARRSWADRVATVAAEMLAATAKRREAKRSTAALRVVRARGADGLVYLVVRGL